MSLRHSVLPRVFVGWRGRITWGHVGTSPQNWDGGGEHEAEPQEWVKLCQSNIGLWALRRACGRHLRAERQPRKRQRFA